MAKQNYDYINQYNRNNYIRVGVRIPKEKKEVLDQLLETTGKSINRLFIDAVEKQYNVDLTLVMSKLVGSE